MIRTSTKTIAGEYTELDTDFMKALIKEKEIQFFHADLTIDGKEYKVVNIPVVILNEYDEWNLYKYLKKILTDLKYKDNIFDYSKWLEE